MAWLIHRAVHGPDATTLEKVLGWGSRNGAELLGLHDVGEIKVGMAADLVLFDPEKPWLCVREQLRSRSLNSPFDGRRMVGRVMRTIIAGETVFERKD